MYKYIRSSYVNESFTNETAMSKMIKVIDLMVSKDYSEDDIRKTIGNICWSEVNGDFSQAFYIALENGYLGKLFYEHPLLTDEKAMDKVNKLIELMVSRKYSETQKEDVAKYFNDKKMIDKLKKSNEEEILKKIKKEIKKDIKEERRTRFVEDVGEFICAFVIGLLPLFGAAIVFIDYGSRGENIPTYVIVALALNPLNWPFLIYATLFN